MPGNTFLHLTTKRAWEDALKVGTYSLSTKGKPWKKSALFTALLQIKLKRPAMESRIRMPTVQFPAN